MLDPLVLAALVKLVYEICRVAFPTLPISEELINGIIVLLLGAASLTGIVRPLVRKFAPQLMVRDIFMRD